MKKDKKKDRHDEFKEKLLRKLSYIYKAVDYASKRKKEAKPK